jgi:large subunit ribosomal protein L32
MPLPKQRHTKSRRNKRRRNIYISLPSLTTCRKCQKPVLPHTVCSNCGYYKGVEVIDVLKKLNRKEKKLKEKEISQKGGEEVKKDKPSTPEGPSKNK